MTTRYRLNRVVTISGASAETSEQPIEWRFDYQDGIGISGTASTRLPSHGRYAYNRGSYAGSWHYDEVHDTDALLATSIPTLELGAQSIYADGTPNTILPSIEASLTDATLDGVEVRFRPERLPDTNYFRWTATGRSDYFPGEAKFHEFIFVYVESPELVGDSFGWDRNERVFFSVEGITAPQSIGEVSNRKAWGAITELGIVSGIVSVGSDNLQTASEETARLVIRYDPDLAQGKSVTDDLGREWTVRSSRAIRDRRFLEFELFRLVA